MSDIYLAARYSRHEEMRAYAALLRQLGHNVLSRWINGGHEISKEGSTQASHAERQVFAQEDLDDLLGAQWCISFTEEPRTTKTRGGRHVEFGVSLITCERVIVIGHRENVFHSLPMVEFYPTWEQLYEVLKGEKV